VMVGSTFRARRPGLGRAVRFVIAGSLGFLVDAGVLLSLESRVGPFAAQSAAYAVAVLVTFALNRAWTFQAGAAPWAPQGIRYVVTTVAGAFVVNGLYAAGVALGAPSLLALAISALVWAVLGYGLMRLWVFRHEGRAS